MKKIIFFSLLLFISITFTGCFEKRELEDLAYVIAVGVDKGTRDNLSITFQLAVPIKIAGEGVNGGEAGSTTLVTLETDSLFNSISRADAMVSKELTLSHNKILVISEEVAKEGIHDLLNAFITNREVRPKTSILVYKGKAKDFLANLKPVLEKNPARYYELLLDSNEYTGYTLDNNLFHFYLASNDDLSAPYALFTEVAQENESSIEVPSISKANPNSSPAESKPSTSGDNNTQNNIETNNEAGAEGNAEGSSGSGSGGSSESGSGAGAGGAGDSPERKFRY